MKHKDFGFSLIELMIVIAIIGILAAIAVPSYQQYIKKGKMSEVIVLLEGFRNELMEIYTTTGSFSASIRGIGNAYYALNSTNGGTENTIEATYYTQTSAAVTIRVSNELGYGKVTYMIIPPTTPSGTFTFRCGFYNDLATELGSSMAYLPSNCRNTDLQAYL